jgi:uncharacterized membrane protein YfcA
MGMAFISAWKHRRHGNLEFRLALSLGVPMMLGIQLGKITMMALDRSGAAGPAVRGIYVLLLWSLGVFMLQDSLRRDRDEENGDVADGRGAPFQRCKWKPLLYLPASAIRVSVWPVAAVGAAVGFLSGMLGAGGGFVLMPTMVYLIGTPTIVAVGTSLMCLVLASPVGVLAYALLHRVEFIAVGIMFGGALVGAPVGVYASHWVRGARLRLLYAVLIMLGGLSVLFRQLNLALAAKTTILGAAGGLAMLIIVLTLAARRRATAAADGQATPE